MLHVRWLNEFKAAMHVNCRFRCLPIGRFDTSVASEPLLSPSRSDTIFHFGI